MNYSQNSFQVVISGIDFTGESYRGDTRSLDYGSHELRV